MTDLVHSVIESGQNKGLHQYKLMGRNADKMMKSSLGAKTSVRDETSLHSSLKILMTKRFLLTRFCMAC
jgi:hypothetical protein